MKELKNIFTIAAGIFAAIPGIGLLTANIDILPGESRMLYGGVLEALSLMTLLVVWLNKKKIEEIKPPRAIKLALTYLFLFLSFLILYVVLLQTQVRDKLVFPLFPVGDLKQAINSAGSIDKLITAYHLEGTQTLIESSRSTLILTKVLFLLLFQIPMILLVLAFSTIGINLRKNEEISE